MTVEDRSRPSLRLSTVCVDCADSEEMADFYARLLGWEVGFRDSPSNRQGGSGWVSLRNPAGGMGLSFQAEEWYEPPVWPEEPGAQTKMIHLEITVDDLDEAVDHAVAAGARVALHQPTDRAKDELRVMLDPAGHPFCLCTQ
jgi:catechol 2,3-dioxygenase-like lactoylglutathione lyase family enzyme